MGYKGDSKVLVILLALIVSRYWVQSPRSTLFLIN